MLHFISWGTFIKTVLVLTAGYYVLIALLFYQKEFRKLFKPFFLLVSLIFCRLALHAQTADGNNGLSQANTMVSGYFETATQQMYAVGAIVGLIGAIRIITTRHREDMGREIGIWIGCCIFLVVVATVLKSFYGL